MKREIKFRAWDKINRKFYYFTLKDIWSEGCETQLIELNDTKRLSLNTDFPYNDYEQFTGLKDKNGVEIYEGDKVKALIRDSDKVGRLYMVSTPKVLIGAVKYIESNCKYVIEFDENEAGIHSCEFGWHNELFEIIGNIHTK